MPTLINEFTGEYRWLSNFWLSPITYTDVEYKSAEHAYQALKTTNTTDHDRIKNAETPGQAKRLGKRIKIREDWDQIKDAVMLLLVQLKFSQNPDLRDKLIETGDMELIEGNHWGDTYWGVDLKTGEGQNKLGEILIKVRRKCVEQKC